MQQTRYASHFLRIGNYLVPYPLLELRDGLLFTCSEFTEEVEATIFIDGVIRLRHANFPEDYKLADVDCVRIDHSALQVFLSKIDYTEIEILFPNY